MSLAEPEGHGELPRTVYTRVRQRQLAHQGNVAAGGRPELPVHAKVIHQVAPAVACAHKSATHAGEPATGRQSQRPLIFPRQKYLLAGNVERARIVARSTIVKVWSQQGIDLQPRQQVLVSLELYMRKDHAMMRVADDLLGQLVAPLGIAVHIAHPQRLRVDVLEGRLQVALLLVDERLPVRNQEFHVADLGSVNGGVVDLVEDAVRAGEPHPACGRVGGAHRIFYARGPTRLQAGATERLALLLEPQVVRLIVHGCTQLFGL